MVIESVVAFVGGVLSLLSPCSALLLPAFFAYAFPSRGQLLLRTVVFYLGLITLLVPIGLGIGALGSLFLERRAELSLIAGAARGVCRVARFLSDPGEIVPLEPDDSGVDVRGPDLRLDGPKEGPTRGTLEVAVLPDHDLGVDPPEDRAL